MVDAFLWGLLALVPHLLPSAAGSGRPAGGAEIDLPDLQTGAFSHVIPIDAPPGSKGMTPELELIYNSGGQNCWIGYGWDLQPPYIERSTRKGVPSYDDAKDFFMFVSSGAR